jgi:hypothetical protein
MRAARNNFWWRVYEATLSAAARAYYSVDEWARNPRLIRSVSVALSEKIKAKLGETVCPDVLQYDIEHKSDGRGHHEKTRRLVIMGLAPDDVVAKYIKECQHHD